VKRFATLALGLYLLFAVIGRVTEKMGLVECGCAPDCWCKRPVLSLFRWAFPYGHHGYGLEKPAEGEGVPNPLTP